MAGDSSSRVKVGKELVRVTNLTKVLYPSTGTTKAEVIAYYQSVAPWLIPHSAWRPATRKRWPDGVGARDGNAQPFFHKGLDERSTPAWVTTAPLTHDDGEKHYPLVNDAATLVWLAQLAALEIHGPQWKFNRQLKVQNPDRLVLDLDPGTGATMDQCVELAHLVREILEGAGMRSIPVMSGSKGIHVYAALDGSLTSNEASALAHQLATSLESMRPDLVVSDMKKSLRDGKILLDWSQNNGSKTTIAPYSLRGRNNPTVATPRTWAELDSAVQQLEFTDVLLLLQQRGDPLAELLSTDRLETYRSMRDADVTPEPVPQQRAAGGSGNSFVIQRHQARRLHHDFRLEHDGVLVSWALPKGPPTDPGRNHLAVQTEDHPLEYANFEGDIPQGQYGGGHVDLWDSGTYELEKWRDGKEVIATLHGLPDGGLGGVPRKFALIHTGMGGEAKNWLIHLMDVDTTPKLTPMLASAGSLVDVIEGEWVHEIKWDGYRCMASLRGEALKLTSRGGQDLTPGYPELSEIASALEGHDAVIDGEIVVLDDQGISRFNLLQKHPREGEAHFMAFDVLRLDGESLLERPWRERRARLEGLIAEDLRFVHVPPILGHDAADALATSEDLGLEGIVSKLADSRYLPGARSGSWIKIKHSRTQEAIIIGWSDGNGSRGRSLGSLLLAVPDADGSLHYIGKVGSGFSDDALQQTHELLSGMEVIAAPDVDVPTADARSAHWVEPLLVGEVSYTEWTASGRLRHPVWRGWRSDKRSEDVLKEN